MGQRGTGGTESRVVPEQVESLPGTPSRTSVAQRLPDMLVLSWVTLFPLPSKSSIASPGSFCRRSFHPTGS